MCEKSHCHKGHIVMSVDSYHQYIKNISIGVLLNEKNKKILTMKAQFKLKNNEIMERIIKIVLRLSKNISCIL